MKKILLSIPILFLITQLASATVSYTSQSPVDLAQTLDTTPDFTFTAYSDMNNTLSCSLYIDNNPYGTNSSVVNNTEATITANSTLSNGDHTWYINCTDINGTYQSSSRTIGIGSGFSRCAYLIDDYGSYQLTGDIINSGTSKCINIQANNIVLGCQGHTIDGNDVANYGVYINGVNNNTIKNCTLTDWNEEGIYFLSSNDNTLEYSNISSCNGDGIIFQSSSNNQIINVTSSNNNAGAIVFYLDSNNSEVRNSTFSSSASGVLFVIDCNNNKVINSFIVNNTARGVKFDESINNQVINSTISGNLLYDVDMEVTSDIQCNNYLYNVVGEGGLPIEYYNSSVNLSDKTLAQLVLCNADYSNLTNISIAVSKNAFNIQRTDFSNFNQITCSNTRFCFYFLSSNNNTIENSIFFNNDYAIRCDWDDNNNTVKNSTFDSNDYAVYLTSGDGNEFYFNKIEDSTSYGVYMSSVSNNKFYNNLFNNTNNVRLSTNLNYWNTTKQLGTRIYTAGIKIGGNYWANPSGTGYSETCNDTDKDGFCDDPYIMNSNNIDYLPLSSGCQCINWIGYSCINTNTRYYTRTCPSDCDIEVKYESDPSCFSEQYGTASVILPLLPLLLVIGIAIYIFKSAMLTYDDIIKILLTVLVAVALLGVMVAVIWF